MKPMLRLLAFFLALLLSAALGCGSPQSCAQVEEPDARSAEKDALWESLKAARPAPAQTADPALKVVVIDVGQGDSILLVSPEGKTMLVDAGPDGSFRRIDDVLKANGIFALDVVVATHPHEDHIGAMADVLRAYPVGSFYTIPQEQETEWYARMLSALEACGVTAICAEGGTTIPWADSCAVTVLNPIPSYDAPADLNDSSIVLRVRYGETAVLLTGDAGETAEQRMLDTFPRSMLKANLLKLGHHGSSGSTGYSFFLAVDPDAAVASCGADNEYGHPHLETLSLLYDTHTAFYRTDLDGTITFRLDGTSVFAEPSRKEIP